MKCLVLVITGNADARPVEHIQLPHHQMVNDHSLHTLAMTRYANIQHTIDQYPNIITRVSRGLCPNKEGPASCHNTSKWQPKHPLRREATTSQPVFIELQASSPRVHFFLNTELSWTRMIFSFAHAYLVWWSIFALVLCVCCVVLE